MEEGSWTEASVYTTPRSVIGLQQMWAGQLDEARTTFEHELAEYERHAMFTVRQEVLCYLAELECRAGQVARRRGLRGRGDGDRRRIGSDGDAASRRPLQPGARRGPSWTGRRRPELGDGRGSACAVERRPLQRQLEPRRAGIPRALARRARARLEHLEPVVRYLDRMGSAEPGIIPCIPDAIEALIALGRLDEAESLLDRLTEQGRARAVRGRSRRRRVAVGSSWLRAATSSEHASNSRRRSPSTATRSSRSSSVGP